jgi:Asp-tRNA(Asn)/Glu-tRNA(Gln) amidotransferase A subunit family amidase
VVDGLDVLLTLSAPGEAPEGLGATGDPVFNRIWTALGVPCISVPGLTGLAGMPVGVQVVGRWGDDQRMLAAAAAVGRSLS